MVNFWGREAIIDAKIHKIIGQKEGSNPHTSENGKILLVNKPSLNCKDICLWGGQDKGLEILCRLLRLDLFIMDGVLS
jgi:hypothetical protein